MFVKKGDKVKVITGKDKNKEGVVLAAFPKKDKVVVEGVNVVKKHQKPSQTAPQWTNLTTAQLCKHQKLIKSLSTWVLVMLYRMQKT